METDILLIDYSEKAVAIQAEKDCGLSDDFEAVGGKFNYRLKFGAGWIFSRKKSEESIKAMLSYYGITFASVALSDIVSSVDETDKPGTGANKLPDYILSDKERKEWIAENFSSAYTDKDFAVVVKLSGGEYVAIGRTELKTEFWHHDEGPGYEEHCRITDNEQSMRDYFLSENLSDLQDIIDWLNNKQTRGYKRYLWLINSNKGDIGAWHLDRSQVNPEATNAIECLDTYERGLYNQGLYKKLSQDDKERLITGFKLAMEKREKRCKTWLKRYGVNKLSFRTYWADR